MTRRSATVFVVAAIGAALSGGCISAQQQMEQQRRGYNAERVGHVSAIVEDLVRARRPLTAEQAKALMPDPEMSLSIAALPEFLQTQPGYDKAWIAESMETIHRGFTWSHEQLGHRSQDVPIDTHWQTDESFLGCTIWLYCWRRPDEIVIGGVIPCKTGIVASAYFLLQDKVIVDYGCLRRKAK